MTSLKEESLEDKLKEKFLKEANKHYAGLVKKDPELKAQRTIGYVFSAGGIPIYLSSGHPMSLLPLGVGIFSIIRSYTRRKKRKKELLSKLERRIKNFSVADLEKRIEEKDYSLPEPTEEEINVYLARQYAEIVKKDLRRKKYSIFRYPTEMGGAAVGVYGCLQASSSPYLGAALGIAGATMFLVSGLWKNIQLNKAGKKVFRYLQENPDQLAYLSDTTPFEFYKKKVK